jgi:hypothetical protein
MTVKAKKPEHYTHTKKKAHPHQSVAKQTVLPATSRERPGSKRYEPPEQKPLFPWDTHWSAIPTALHDIIYSALASSAVTARSDSTGLLSGK